jgi:hypothetical protein
MYKVTNSLYYIIIIKQLTVVEIEPRARELLMM